MTARTLGFLPTRILGQTIEDIWRGEAIFIVEVAAVAESPILTFKMDQSTGAGQSQTSD